MLRCAVSKQLGDSAGNTPVACRWRAVLRAMPAGVPWAIEYPLAGDDLLDVTRREIAQLRGVSSESLE